MPYTKPSVSQVHIDSALTNVSIAFAQSASNFVAARVFPVVPVTNKSDSYHIVPAGDWNRDEAQERAPSTESAGGTYDQTSATYAAKVYAFHKDVDDQVASNSDPSVPPERAATLFVTQKMLIKRDRDWASKYFVTGVWTNERAGVASGPTGTQFLRWDDDNSTPIKDVRAMMTSAALSSGGFRPNVAVASRKVVDALVDHPDFVGRVTGGQTTGMAQVTNQQLAGLFGLDELLVLDGVYNTALEGATASNSFVGGNHFGLFYRTSAPAIMTPSAGYTFAWTGYLGANAAAAQISRIRADLKKSWRIEGEAAYDQKLVAADCGALFLNAVS